MEHSENKVMTAAEAVRRFIRPGAHIAFGGFTILRRPMTIAREIVRQNVGGLFVTMNGGTVAEEMLAGAGLIKWLETTYLGMEGGMPVAYAIRKSIEQGKIELVEDYSNWSFAQRTLAGRLGLPFMPCMGDLGSDILEYDTFGKAGLRTPGPDGALPHPGMAANICSASMPAGTMKAAPPAAGRKMRTSSRAITQISWNAQKGISSG